tara:strand:+ start:153 stop:2252 length:2100 start_codon:yes stop_codon:yes gene_type:complete
MRRNGNTFTVYLANLTHDDIALANGTFPIGVGYVASALKAYFQNNIHVEIFKYPGDLERAILAKVPDAFLFSNYVWTQYLPMSFARRLKERFPDTLIIGGGPNISKDAKKQEEYLKNNTYIDFYILYEGEIPACLVLKNYLELECNINKLKDVELPSTITLLSDGTLKSGKIAPRIGTTRKLPNESDLDNVVNLFSTYENLPSPYLTGLMDKFFDNRLYPLVETSRGCPFTCSYCQQGNHYFSKVAHNTIDRVKAELDYIADHMTKYSPGIFHIEITDPNFAMYSKDLEICEHIRGLQEKYKWPRFIGCSTGKNKPEIILNAVSKLMPDSLVISNSMQSTNVETLEAVKRGNIKLESYAIMQTEIHKRGLRSNADIILGLPLETKDSHFRAVYNLIDSGIQKFTSYQAMILKSTDLELDSAKNEYGLKTKWRMIPRAIGRYTIYGVPVVVSEAEEIVVATNTLSYEEYLDSRRLHLTTMIYHNSEIFDLIDSYLITRSCLKKSDLISEIYKYSWEADFPLKKVYNEFLEKTQSELFDSERECLDYYALSDNLDRVRKSEIGNNLLFTFLSVTTFEYWFEAVEVILTCMGRILELEKDEISDLRGYFRGRVTNVSQSTIIQNIKVDINSSNTIAQLAASGIYQAETSDKYLCMHLSNKNYEVLTHSKTVYPNNRTGWSLILSVNLLHSIIRNPVNLSTLP